MSLITVVALAIGLGMDAMAVAVVVGMTVRTLTLRHFFRLSFHFGLFQFLMPIIGWFAGRQILDWIAPFDHWIALLLLTWIGGRMIRGDDEQKFDESVDPTRGLSLVFMSIATSIDALAVGLSLGALGAKIVGPSIIIGVVASLMTICGMLFGRRIGRNGGRTLEIIGGVILIAIGLKILVEHLFLSS